MLGGAVGQFSHALLPQIVAHPGAFALVGMGAFFAGVAKAPVGALLMVCEMTGGYGLVVPLMFASVVAILLSQRWSLYEKQLLNKFHSPAHRQDTVVNVLQALKVADVMRRDTAIAILPEEMTFAGLKRLMTRTTESFFPVVNDSFRLRGVLSMSHLREVLFEDSVSDLLIVGELALPPVSVGLDDTLYDTLSCFLESGFERIPVVDEDFRVVGTLRFSDLMGAYHGTMQQLRSET
jgi:CIC family chloride channel protein